MLHLAVGRKTRLRSLDRPLIRKRARLCRRMRFERRDLLPVALVAGGFAALAAGLAVAAFLVTWLRPVRTDERALAG